MLKGVINIMNILRTINNPEIGDVFELFVPPDPIWRYTSVYNIVGNKYNL